MLFFSTSYKCYWVTLIKARATIDKNNYNITFIWAMVLELNPSYPLKYKSPVSECSGYETLIVMSYEKCLCIKWLLNSVLSNFWCHAIYFSLNHLINVI